MKLNTLPFLIVPRAIRCSILFCMMLLAPLSLFAQSHTINGIVKDASGQPLIGVAVQLKGNTKTGTITDINGKFSIAAPTNSSLVFSYVGYVSQTLPANTSMAVTLSEDTQKLDELVVVGYGTVKKRDLTGAVATVKSDAITLTPASDPMESLQGRVPGLDITKTSGQAGQGVNMQVRGARSFTTTSDGTALASTSPLFIIDGMPGDYSTLNPNDIESIEVLKDASSTAVYGSQGANGVVIITTKKGKEGKLNVNFNTYAGFNGWSVLPKMRSGDGYMNIVRQAQQEAGTYTDDADMIDASIYAAYKNGQNIDWAKALLHTGNVQNYSLSLSGGTPKTKTYVSINYSNENGQCTNDRNQILSSIVRVDHQVNKIFAAGFNLQGSYTMKNSTYSKLYNALIASPFGTLYNADGSVNPFPVVGNSKQVNLLLDQDKSLYINDKNGLNLYVTPYIRLTPVKGLTIESRLNGTLGNSTAHYFQGYGSYQFYDALGTGALSSSTALQSAQVYAKISNNEAYSYKWENILTYNLKLANIHEFTFTGATSYDYNQNEAASSQMTGITSNIYNWTNLYAGTGAATVTSQYYMKKDIGLVERVSYSLLGKYLLSASMREDAASVLAKGHRWSSFPAVAAGWRLSDEKFMEPTKKWLDNLKIRLGYGEAGTQNVPPYTSVAVLNQGNMSLGGVKTTDYYYSQNMNNPYLTWERSHNFNVGLDLSFLNNRIDLTADYYITKTTGVIWTQTQPVTEGAYNASSYYTVNTNLASTKNRGIELTLNTKNIVTKDFKWASAVTFSKDKDQVTSLGAGSQDYAAISSTGYVLHVGSAINSYYNYKIAGIWQKGEAADAAVFNAQPGDYKIDIPGLVHDGSGQYHKTINGVTTNYSSTNKYAVGANDYQIIGHASPDWSLGFQNTFTYKDFDLSVYAYARYGQMINYSLLGAYDNTGLTNFPTYFNYWTSTNPSNDFPALNSSRSVKNLPGYYASTYVDGSFFKIKNVTLGYTMPKKWCKILNIEKLRVYGTITNPLIVAKSHLLKDYDPEMAGSLDYPSTKQLVFGLNLTF